MQEFYIKVNNLNERHQSEVRVMVVLGIIKQLLSTRYSKIFNSQILTQSQFNVLNHFTHRPERNWLVSDLAKVMEMNQPGITKIVTVLVERGLLEATADAYDKRKRLLKITSQGLKVCQDMIQSLLPDISLMLSEWDDNDLSHLRGNLEKLMTWLDENRIS